MAKIINYLALRQFFLKKHKSCPHQADFTVYDGSARPERCDIFMLAVVAYPLLFTMLPKKGTSNTQERIDLVQRYINLFGRETFDCLLADREFVNQNLKPIRILKHGRKAKCIFRYGLDIVAEFLTRGRNDYDVPIFGILSTENPIFTPA